MPGAITGFGMRASVGRDSGACYEALCAGATGLSPLRAFDRALFNGPSAYEIDDRPPGGDVPLRATAWLREVVAEAVAMAGLSPAEAAALPVLVGTGLRELRSLELWWADRKPLSAEALHFGGALRELLGGQAPVYTFSNACSASSFALGLAEDMLQLGEAEAVIVAGCDSMTESMFGLAARANPVIAERLQPFDRDRKGVVLGEGAAAVVLEREDRAAARGARALARLRAVGLGCDAFHETAPSLEGVQRSMRDAHRRAGVEPGQIELLMAHGTGTALNDENELRAFKAVFGPGAAKVMIAAIKSMTGHTSGGSALMSLITAVQAMRHGRVPPIVGLDHPLADGEGLDFVTGQARSARVRLAQVDAFGFGGVNAVAILEAPHD